jgi:hypothetical protein
MEPPPNRAPIIAAVIAAAGAVVVAVISNWGKISGGPVHGPDKNSVSQTSYGSDSPNISNVQGNVTVGSSRGRLVIPTIAGSIAVKDGLDSDRAAITEQQLSEFIDSNRGKLVHISIAISADQSAISRIENRTSLGLSDTPCATPDTFFSYCMEDGLVLIGSGYELGYYVGANRLNGYFTIDESAEMHQGRWFSLRAVSPDSVLLRTQTAERQ